MDVAKALFSPSAGEAMVDAAAAAISLSSSPMDEEGAGIPSTGTAAHLEQLAVTAAAVATEAASTATSSFPSAQHMHCILHMDSLGMHGSVAIGKRLAIR